MTKIVLGFVLLGGMSSTAFSKNQKKTCLSIEGMSCSACSDKIKKRLGTELGIFKTEVSLRQASAEVYFESDKTNPKKISEIISSLGYKANEQACK